MNCKYAVWLGILLVGLVSQVSHAEDCLVLVGLWHGENLSFEAREWDPSAQKYSNDFYPRPYREEYFVQYEVIGNQIKRTRKPDYSSKNTINQGENPTFYSCVRNGNSIKLSSIEKYTSFITSIIEGNTESGDRIFSGTESSYVGYPELIVQAHTSRRETRVPQGDTPEPSKPIQRSTSAKGSGVVVDSDTGGLSRSFSFKGKKK